MADSNITKRALAAALKELMEQEPFEKISVSDICEGCGMNRKSFYYHFRDKYDLVNWIFDMEFFRAASQQTDAELWDFVHNLCGYFYENRNFYRRALKIEGQNSFLDHFKMTLASVLGSFLQQVLAQEGKEFADPADMEFYINFYTDALIGAFVRWLSEKDCLPPEKFSDKIRSCVRILVDYQESL